MNEPVDIPTRVTVVSPLGRHQLDLPASAPVASFLPDLVASAGLHPGPAGAGGAASWQLTDGAGRLLGAAETLAAAGIEPGAVLQLRAPTDSPSVPRPTGPGAGAGVGAGVGAGPAGPDAGFGAGLGASAGPGAEASAFTPPLNGSGGPAAAGAEDGLTPLQRSAAVVSRPVPRLGRTASAVGAFFRAPLPAGSQDVPVSLIGAPASARPQLVAPASGLAGSPRSVALTLAQPPSRPDRVRRRWRALDHLGQLDALIAAPRLARCATVALVSPKGGVGKTTVTALLGTLLSLLRRDPVVAVDTNPDFGSLGRVLTPDQDWYVDDLLGLIDDATLSLTSLDARLGRAVHGLLVVPAPTDPTRMTALDEDSYRRVITRLKDFFSLILLDCGTGLQDHAARAAIAAADQVVLITDGEPATASLVAQAAELLDPLRRPLTIVVNRMPRRGWRLDLEQLARYVPAARGVVVVPDEPRAAAGLSSGGFDWRDAPQSWQVALRSLAVVRSSDWSRLGLRVDEGRPQRP